MHEQNFIRMLKIFSILPHSAYLFRTRLCLIFMGMFGLIYLFIQLMLPYWTTDPLDITPHTLNINVAPHNLRTLAPLHRSIHSKPTKPVSPQSKVLVIITSSALSDDAERIISVLQAQRLEYYTVRLRDLYNIAKYLHSHDGTGGINLIIFEDFILWSNLPDYVKQELDNYCRIFGVGVIGFLANENLLNSENNTSASFLTKDYSYPLLINRLSSVPLGFYLASESPVLRIARGGQYDPAPVLPSTNIYKNATFWRCSNSLFQKLLGAVQSETDQFAFQLPTYENVLRRQHQPCVENSKKPPKLSSSTLVPLAGKQHLFQTIAFTKIVALDKTDYVNQASCAFSEQPSVGADKVYQSVVIEDIGGVDDIKRILFAHRPLRHWSTSLLLVDSIRYLIDKLSKSKPFKAQEYDLGLTRWVHIDIDDIFVAAVGSRITPDDVQAMIRAQNRWRKWIPDFTFSLGFSGNTFGRGTPIEVEGDLALIENRDKFVWFCHTFGHTQPHLMTEDELTTSLEQNKQFAKLYQLPIQPGYAIAPHHSGVYPVIPALFRAWKRVWNVRVTTTEEYPHLFPAWQRRGFLFDGINVLPRQTCGVFTHTLLLDKYPNGPQTLNNMIAGGDIFDVLLHTPVSAFMTHFGNYGHDRLALYVFDAVFRFLRSWTNLELRTAPPLQLIAKHTAFNPLETATLPDGSGLPLHANPCADSRHLDIWPTYNWSCDAHHLPHTIIVGPQKTGTTALLAYMSIHPRLVPNRVKTEGTFEEIQFFSNDRLYAHGLGWYLDQFRRSSNELSQIGKTPSLVGNVLFEKSATYFDSHMAPFRLRALLPGAKIIIILKNPLDRAHSWYQHQRAHNDEAALAFTFENVISADTMAAATSVVKNSRKGSDDINRLASKLYALHCRSVHPGFYSTSLWNWLQQFPPRQILLIDSDKLDFSPALVMDNVQEFLGLGNSFLDYRSILLLDAEKNFSCISGGPYPAAGRILKLHPTKSYWCLSSGKGRSYPRLTRETSSRLEHVFSKKNRELFSLILNFPFWRSQRSTSVLQLIPSWLYNGSLAT